jgi:hypothetical protein
MAELTAVDIYQPTKVEMSLLEVLLNPDNIGIDITDICKLAGVSRQTYYNSLKKADFIKYKNELTIDMLKGIVQNVVNATYKFATTDSNCHADRKILLTMSGLYVDKQKIEHSGEVVIFKGDDTLAD